MSAIQIAIWLFFDIIIVTSYVITAIRDNISWRSIVIMRKKIAVFAAGWASNILVQCLNGMNNVIEGEDVDIYLFLNYAALNEPPELITGELNIFKLPDINDFDGVVICANLIEFKDEIEQIVNKAKFAGIPVVSIGATVKDTISIVSDNYSGMHDLAEHLVVTQGIRDYFVVAGSRDNEGGEQRIKALKDVLNEHGIELPEDHIFYTDWLITEADHLTRKWCREKCLPRAIVCANDALALNVCLVLKEFNVRVPEDVVVTGFDNIPDARIFFPSLTTVDQNFTLCGEEAARILFGSIEGKKYEPVIVIDSTMVLGESCGCPENTGSVMLRQQAATNSYMKHNDDLAQMRYDRLIERTILSCESISEIRQKLTALLAENHDYEGDNFHIFMDETAYRSVCDVSVSMRRAGFDEELSVIISMCDGQISEEHKFRTAELVPHSKNEKNHLYIFVPLYFNQYSAGYMVFCDLYKALEEKTLRAYYQGINYSMEKFRQNMYLKYMNERITELAQIDTLTHIKNRAAYDKKRKELQNNIDVIPGYEFGIVMFDANNLKAINDEYGHEAGDQYLKNCCSLICRVFAHSPVYRIGGDEFLAVLEGNDYVDREVLMSVFQRDMMKIGEKAIAPEEKVSVASGMCVFDSKNHNTVEDIRNCADERMYENKKTMKHRED